MSPTEVQRYKHSNAIEMRDGITFDFYTGLPHIYCFVFVFFLCLFIFWHIPLLVTSLPPAPCLPYTLYFYLLLFATRKKRSWKGLIDPLLDANADRKLGKSPIVRTVKGWGLQNWPFNLLKVKKAKEVYQLGFQVCRPWKSRVKNQFKAENVYALTSQCVLHIHALNRQLNFWGSRFSRIAIFEEIILQIICMRMQQTQYTTGVAYKPGLSNTHGHTISSARARSFLQSNAYFGGISLEWVSCGFGSLAPGCCPSMLLQSECENCVSHKNFRWNIFTNGWKFAKFTKL